MLKYLLPFDRFVIRSPLSAADATAALQAVVEPKKLRVFDKREKAFEGTIEEGNFDIRRLIGYRNSFLPMIRGKVEAVPGGCTVRVTMRLMIAVMVFCAFWLTGVVSACIVMTTTEVRETEVGPFALVPFGMLAFFLVLVNGAFWFEANKQKKVLMDLFGGTDG